MILRRVAAVLLAAAAPTAAVDADARPGCAHPEPVCAARQAVLPVEGVDGPASGVRIGPRLIVTTRSAVADRAAVRVGLTEARIIASAYRGDLALLQIDEAPTNHPVLSPAEGPIGAGPFFVVAADPQGGEIRVIGPGGKLADPHPDARLGRLHLSAATRPSVAGGAVVDAAGRLVGIAAPGGGERLSALPAQALSALKTLQSAPQAVATQAALGQVLRRCAAAIPITPPPERLAEICLAGDNFGQLLAAGRTLAEARKTKSAVALHRAAVAQAPNAPSALKALLISLQLDGRDAETPRVARRLLNLLPDDPAALRLVLQAGARGGDLPLAEAAYAAISRVAPYQAAAARAFLDRAAARGARPRGRAGPEEGR